MLKRLMTKSKSKSKKTVKPTSPKAARATEVIIPDPPPPPEPEPAPEPPQPLPEPLPPPVPAVEMLASVRSKLHGFQKDGLLRGSRAGDDVENLIAEIDLFMGLGVQ